MLDQQTRGAILRLRKDGHSIRHISGLLSLSRGSVRKVVRIGTDEVPAIHRPSKLEIHRERIVQLLMQYHGNIFKVYRVLADAGMAVRYATLTAFCRRNRLLDHVSDNTHSPIRLREWPLHLTNGKRSLKSLPVELPDADIQLLLFHLKHGGSRRRKKAATILARQRGIPNSVIAKAIQSSCKTTRRYYRIYLEAGLQRLFTWNTNRQFGDECEVSERRMRILELIHHKPTSYGINRTNWTQPALLKAYGQLYGAVISKSALAKIISSTGYRWKKARRVLTSPDPNYHEKVELLLNTLRRLGTDEMFFFLDEWGPVQVRKRGGKAYRTANETIPRRQVSRGSVSLIGALSATTNQVTWHFLESKDSHAMMDMIEILYNRYHTNTKLYITWDAVAWHNSGPFLEALDQFNEVTRAMAVGPIIELVPLPTSSQFLNVIEGILSGMTRAVINNSDYMNAGQMKEAISKHFTERNEHFKHNPKRVGKKIWEFDFFQDFDALRAGNYKDW